MKRLGESVNQRIMRTTKRKITFCKCKKCQSQCNTPCLGTPDDILKLIEAGYADRLAPTMWSAGMLLGVTNHSIYLIASKTGEDGMCTFFHGGLCELHDKGLKPLEGKLSHHSTAMDNWTPKRSISWNVAKEWEDEQNADTIEKIFNVLNTR